MAVKEAFVENYKPNKVFERRYQAYWFAKNGRSPLSSLGAWMVQHHARLQGAPRDLLVAAANDVVSRMPLVAVREPTRRHRKHFMWLLRWYLILSRELGRSV